MNRGYLSSYFTGITWKRLSAVEADPSRSNQHEFNGISAMKQLFGCEKITFDAKFIFLRGSNEEPVTQQGFLTWYESRRPPRSEYRLYFSVSMVSHNVRPDDFLIVGKRGDNSILIIVVEEASTYENQIKWLFGIEEDAAESFKVKTILSGERSDRELNFVSRLILETIGVEPEETDGNLLDRVLSRFGDEFPTTTEFSAFARSTLQGVSSEDDPDKALMEWMEQEEVLFRTLEKHIVSVQLRKGFGTDVEKFIAYSLSVQNRRKSRAGFALENHLEQIFIENKVRYSRNGKTENKCRPDFIFPDISKYRDASFPENKLTMLGVKSTCKDRWRQVLSEASRVRNKHLLTIEPGISENQTNEMQSHCLQLVVPEALKQSFLTSQQAWLINVSEFLSLVKSRQK